MIFLNFVCLFNKKIINIKIKREKNIMLLISFLQFFLHPFTKFYVLCFILAQVIMHNVILNKFYFCKNAFFCQNLVNFDQNFQKFLSSKSVLWFYSWSPWDNFGGFNINIEDFISKNSEKITKNYPSIFYIKVETPEI